MEQRRPPGGGRGGISRGRVARQSPSGQGPSGQRPGGSRRLQPEGGGPGVPPLVIAAIAVPALAIIVLVAWQFMRDRSPDVNITVEDPNKEFGELKASAGRLQAKFKSIVRLERDDPGRVEKLKALRPNVDAWLQKFEDFSKPFQDSEGYLKDEYRGTLVKVRHEMNILSGDLGKEIPF